MWARSELREYSGRTEAPAVAADTDIFPLKLRSPHYPFAAPSSQRLSCRKSRQVLLARTLKPLPIATEAYTTGGFSN